MNLQWQFKWARIILCQNLLRFHNDKLLKQFLKTENYRLFMIVCLCNTNEVCLGRCKLLAHLVHVEVLSSLCPIQSNSSMHHYECAALYKDINLQRGRFWASSLASCSSRSRKERSPWMVFILVERGHPRGCLQLSGGGSKMTWLASAFSSTLARCLKQQRRRDLTMDESGGWLIICEC